MSDNGGSSTTRSPKVAIWLGLLAVVCLVGTYMGLLPLPVAEGLALGAVIAFAVHRKRSS
jgi:hypothetical protein